MDRFYSQNPLSSFTRTRAPTRTQTIMSTETRREIYHTTMEISPPFSPIQDTQQNHVMASVEIAYKEGHQDGYKEGWDNCNRDIHDVVVQERYDDGIRQGTALAADEITELRKKIEELEETHVSAATEQFNGMMKKYKMSNSELDELIQLRDNINPQKPKKVKQPPKKKPGETGRGGVAKERHAEFRWIEEHGGVIQHVLREHYAEATYAGNEKFTYTFNGVTKTSKISGFCTAHSLYISTLPQYDFKAGAKHAYNGWDVCAIKDGEKGV